jgi:hypothetical protein
MVRKKPAGRGYIRLWHRVVVPAPYFFQVYSFKWSKLLITCGKSGQLDQFLHFFFIFSLIFHKYYVLLYYGSPAIIALKNLCSSQKRPIFKIDLKILTDSVSKPSF